MRTRLSILAMVLVIIALFTTAAWGLGSDASRTNKAGTTTGTWWTVDANSLTSGKMFQFSSTGTITGSIMGITAASMATGNGILMTTNGLTTGNMIKLVTTDSGLTTGNYLACFGATGTTNVFEIGLGGATTITPPATTGVATIPLYIDGTVLTTGDCLKLKAVSGTMTTGKVMRVLDGTTETFAIGDVGDLQLTGVNAASGSANPFDYTGTLGIMNGSDDFTLFDINIDNPDHTGSTNTVQAIDIAAITGDAHATETAIKIGAGWDNGIDCASPVSLGSTAAGPGGGSVVYTKYQRVTVASINSAGATGIPLLTALPGRQYRLLNATLAAYGGAFTSTNATSLEIVSDPAGTPVVLYQVLKAQLAQATTAGVGRNMMAPCTASTVLLADNASFVAQVANKGISLITTTASTYDWATATGVDVWIQYCVD